VPRPGPFPDVTGAAVNPRTRDATRRSLFHTIETPEREAYLLLQHVSGALMAELATVLKPEGVTPEQYHILQILRDAGKDGLPCSTVAERSVSGDPDVTRLLDRLESRGWASRTRDVDDRRVVVARITAVGSRLIARLEDAVADLHRHQMRKLGSREVPQLRAILEKLAVPARE
jgi:DNA-binding MarR family transcriptional regulator